MDNRLSLILDANDALAMLDALTLGQVAWEGAQSAAQIFRTGEEAELVKTRAQIAAAMTINTHRLVPDTEQRLRRLRLAIVDWLHTTRTP